MIKSLLILVLLLVFACGKKEEEKKVKNSSKPIVSEPSNTDSSPEFDLILIDEEFEKEIFLGKFIGGDKLKFEITGKQTYKIFPPIYNQKVQSRYEQKTCLPAMSPLRSRPMCLYIPKTGECEVYKRHHPTNKDRIILFDDDTREWNIKLKIGDNIYTVGKIIENSINRVTTEFTISDEMVLADNNVSLIIKPINDQAKVKVGFIKYGDCPNRGKRNFRVLSSLASQEVTSKTSEKYKVNFYVKNKENY